MSDEGQNGSEVRRRVLVNLGSLDAQLAAAGDDLDAQLEVCGVHTYSAIELYQREQLQQESDPQRCPISGNLVYDPGFSRYEK